MLFALLLNSKLALTLVATCEGKQDSSTGI
jgi:hypothetical protein